MSSIGICALLTRAGYGTIYQISCRDRNRIAIQGDVLGAAAMGVRNVLCLTGDGVGVGDQPGAKPVFDFDSLTLLRTIRTMRDDGVFLSGRKITRRPHMFLGAAENPCVPPYDWRAERLAKKIDGRRRVHPDQLHLRPAALRALHGAGPRPRARPAGLHPRRRRPARLGQGRALDARATCPASTSPTRSSTASSARPRPAAEGTALCIELIQQIREIPGVAGVHVMAYRREHQVSEIVLRSGVRGGGRIG